MRSTLIRLSALVVGIAVVASCDGGPFVNKFGKGIAGGATGTQPVAPPAPGSVDTNRPFVRIDTPVAVPQQLINAGDSILVVVRAIDDRKIGTVTIRGLQYKGAASLGTLQEIERYPAVSAPGAAVFRPALVDTIIRRYLKPATPVDTSVDSLVLQAIVLDSAGNADTTRRTIQLVNGPKVIITAPVPNDSVPRGIQMSVSVQADHPAGIDTIEIHVTGEANWPTRLDTIVKQSYPSGTFTAVLTTGIAIPANAPPRGRITINARARDRNRNQGNAPPIVVFARAASSVAPRVYQTVPFRLEYADSITVTATADGVKSIGRLILDSALNVVDSAEIQFVSPFKANQTVKIFNNLSLPDQGRRLSVISFATDSAGVKGWSLAAGNGTPVTVRANAFRDTTLIVFGRTYALPRAGVAGDIAVDTSRGNVFVSNTRYNLLELWDNTTKTFTANGVPVGAQPWGLFATYTPGHAADRLLVANSGSTTISKVDMGASPPAEALIERLRTTNIANYSVLFTINSAGFLVLDYDGALNQYSDRPQYVVQSEGGRIFYSTKPTSVKLPGTIRWFDPSLPIQDPRQIFSYGRTSSSATERYLVFNADSIAVHKTAAGTNSFSPDTLVVCDHPYGGKHGTVPPLFPPGTLDAAGNPLNDPLTTNDDRPFCVPAVTRASVVDSVRKYGGDVEMVLGLDLTSLSLTDTTFVAASGDGKWVAFGEGNAATTLGSGVNRATTSARVVLAYDPSLPAPNNLQPQFYSPPLTVDDIQENAANKLFGLALGATGLQLLGHTDETFVAAVSDPTLVTTGIFHLRLDGVYSSFSNGGGVAFHPLAAGTNTPLSANRIAFTATKTGVIEAFDVAHYNNRGVYQTKGNLYGPLRVTLPLTAAESAAGVVLKLYGLTDAGLIVIDLLGSQILP